MTRAFLVLAVVVAGLVALRARFGDRGPGASARIERLAVLASDRTVAAVSVETSGASGEDVRWLFARSKGRWRAREAFGAYLDEAAFQAWFADLLDARGALADDDPARAEAFGLGPKARVRVALHGTKVLEAPDKDELAVFELGRAGGRAFGRRAGDARILELDRDLLAPLGPLAPGVLPALVDLHLLAGSLEPGTVGLARVVLEHRGGERLVLERGGPGDAEPKWTLARAGAAPEDVLPWRAGGFMGLLFRGRGLGFAAPSEAPALGLDAPLARLVLQPDAGQEIELLVSDKNAANEAWVWNRRSNLVLRIDAATHAELVPDAAAFTTKDGGNPWERWLQNLGPKERR